MVQDGKPDYFAVVFDAPGRTFRDDLFPEYKANRSAPPTDLELQIPLIKDMLEALRVPVLGEPGYEADDVIATVAVAAARKGMDVFICSSDKDCRQLLGDRVKVFDLRKQRVYDRDALLQDWGIAPEQVGRPSSTASTVWACRRPPRPVVCSPCAGSTCRPPKTSRPRYICYGCSIP